MVKQLVFINPVGVDNNGEFTYNFLCSNDSSLTWGTDWSVQPAGICGDIPPAKETYDTTKILRTTVKLKVAQKNTCFSMQDCTDGIIALAYEDISDYEEYPDHRLIFHFGESIDKVEQQLLIKGLEFDN